jgi:hypothetical protein
MSKAGYLEQIEFKIAAHQQTVDALLGEIQKLRNAAEVIAQLRGNDLDGGPVTLEVTPDKKRSSPITIRKIGGPDKGGRRSRGLAQRQELRQRIEALLRDNGPLPAGQIRHKLDMVDKQHDRTIWGTLYYMSTQLNTIVKADGKYHIANDRD